MSTRPNKHTTKNYIFHDKALYLALSRFFVIRFTTYMCILIVRAVTFSRNLMSYAYTYKNSQLYKISTGRRLLFSHISKYCQTTEKFSNLIHSMRIRHDIKQTRTGLSPLSPVSLHRKHAQCVTFPIDR